MTAHPRSQIYYWKCDRPAAFHGIGVRLREDAVMVASLQSVLVDAFPGAHVDLRVAASQGNHLTFIASIDGVESFVRVEDGPEGDDYIEVESRVMTALRTLGLPVPAVLSVDASRLQAPFAWQVLEKVHEPDLNQHFKTGRLPLHDMAETIGAAVATWQGLEVQGFGPFDPTQRHSFQGFHSAYADYFHLHLDRHLHFLVERDFLSADVAREMARAIERHHALLALDQGCLVHKDLALWNILGTENRISAFIDFDDVISGDPMDDLSLLACFHDDDVLERALQGYAAVLALPYEHERRLALHLLRNMIVKAVVRVGAGYFDRGTSFFLVNGSTDLRTTTQLKLAEALRRLQT